MSADAKVQFGKEMLLDNCHYQDFFRPAGISQKMFEEMSATLNAEKAKED